MATADEFREAMSRFPAGVTITTTVDAAGKWWGFTASAFCSLSADPPLILVCVAKSAECHPAFMAGESFAVHFLAEPHQDLALLFARRGADKFAGGNFELSDRGLPVLRTASSILECSVHARHEGGDHTILVGQVEDAMVGPDRPVVYFRRDFHSLPLPPEGDVEVAPGAGAQLRAIRDPTRGTSEQRGSA